MSIIEYVKENKIFYEVRASRRTDDGRKIQRRKKNICSLAKAKQLERVLFREIEVEIQSSGCKGPSWGELVENWEVAAKQGRLFRRQLQQDTVHELVAALRAYTSFWWEIPAKDINRVDAIEVFKLMDGEGKSYTRKQKIKSAINTIFEWAINSGELKSVHASPAKEVSIGVKVEKPKEILNINEMRQLLRLAYESGHPWYPVWATALMTGLRNGELFALTWDDIDEQTRTVRVSKSYSSKLKKVKAPKNNECRTVPINDELLKLFRELRLSSGGRREVFPRLPSWSSGAAATVLRRFLEGVGMKPVKFHTLRACFSTELMRQKVAPITVMNICGWKELKTMQVYVRKAGIDISGATDTLQVLPSADKLGELLPLRAGL